MTEKSTQEVFFVVTSGGRAATYWLSHLLNQSTEMFCMHGFFPVSKLASGDKNSPDGFGRYGYEIGNISELDGSAKSQDEWNKIHHEQWKEFDELSLEAYFDELTDIPHIPSKFVEIVPLSHRQGNCIPYAAIRWHDFGNRPALGRPLGHFSRHPDTPLLSLSPRRRFPRPTPERVFVADHQSSSGFSGTGPSAPPPQPIGT